MKLRLAAVRSHKVSLYFPALKCPRQWSCPEAITIFSSSVPLRHHFTQTNDLFWSGPVPFEGGGGGSSQCSAARLRFQKCFFFSISPKTNISASTGRFVFITRRRSSKNGRVKLYSVVLSHTQPRHSSHANLETWLKKPISITRIITTPVARLHWRISLYQGDVTSYEGQIQ